MIEQLLLETRTFFPAQVRSFVDATGDDNPIHRTSRPVLPCLQLALSAKDLLETAHIPLRAEDCKSIAIECRAPIYASEQIQFLTNFTPLGEIKVGLTCNQQPRATATFWYGRLPTEPRKTSDESKYRISHHQFTLAQAAADSVAKSLGKNTPDYLGLALGMASASLLKHGEEQVREKAAKGFCPVYASTKIILLPASTKLGPEDELTITASTRARNDQVIAKTYANVRGEAVYSTSSFLSFEREERLAHK